MYKFNPALHKPAFMSRCGMPCTGPIQNHNGKKNLNKHEKSFGLLYETCLLFTLLSVPAFLLILVKIDTKEWGSFYVCESHKTCKGSSERARAGVHALIYCARNIIVSRARSGTQPAPIQCCHFFVFWHNSYTDTRMRVL
jgi:hypothetical protein